MTDFLRVPWWIWLLLAAVSYAMWDSYLAVPVANLPDYLFPLIGKIWAIWLCWWSINRLSGR